MRIMTALILAGSLWSPLASALTEVICYNHSCLDSGWTIIDHSHRRIFEVRCDEDCRINGWSTYERGRLIGSSYCKDGGCFVSGWTEARGTDGRVMGEVSCFESPNGLGTDCLTGGWEYLDWIYGRRSASRCLNSDCSSNGWDVWVPGGGLANTIRCKAGGCFSEGWIVRP